LPPLLRKGSTMLHDNAARPVLDALPLVTIGSFDLRATPEHAAAYAAGELTLMSTKAAGPCTTLVDSSHTIVGHAGLAKRAGAAVTSWRPVEAAPRGVPAAAALPAVTAAVVVLGAGTWYVLHKRKKAVAAAEDNQSGVETMPVETEAEAE